jgi:hypothetical protein
MCRTGVAAFALAWMAVGAAHGQVLQGGLELRWGDAAPSAQARLAPKFEAALAQDGGGRIALDADQARRGAGDLYALANRRVALSYAIGKSSGMPVIDAIVPADAPAHAAPHVRGGRADGVAKATLGTTRWVTVACRFSDIADEQKPIGFFRDQYGEVAGQLGHYWREVSYDKVDLTGSDAAGNTIRARTT